MEPVILRLRDNNVYDLSDPNVNPITIPTIYCFIKKLESIIDLEGNKYGWSQEAKNEEIKAQAIKKIRGIEKDPFCSS